ncbi:MAG TPA: hypothetical protein VFV19_14715 [Candidatus Polarisedimenticolaceae bacterium]|nr:hypothetical protein [Candidatus Polarisedimenticolaceae bacterium]
MRKVALVLIVVCAAVVGTTALAMTAQKPKLCPPGNKVLHCFDGRIVCCPPHYACDCGGPVG